MFRIPAALGPDLRVDLRRIKYVDDDTIPVLRSEMLRELGHLQALRCGEVR